MRRGKEIVITKADGSLERFGVGKLSNCLATVLQGRAYDPRLAGPLARAVAMHLSEWKDANNPATTEYVFRCVSCVLEQTGLGDVAQDLAQHRRLRAARRRRTQVIDPARATARGLVWHKAAVVATLENRYGLRHGVARFLAGQIEMQVFALNYRLVTRPFLAELVRNEVLAWGLADAQVLQAGADALQQLVGPGRPKEES